MVTTQTPDYEDESNFYLKHGDRISKSSKDSEEINWEDMSNGLKNEGEEGVTISNPIFTDNGIYVFKHTHRGRESNIVKLLKYHDDESAWINVEEFSNLAAENEEIQKMSKIEHAIEKNGTFIAADDSGTQITYPVYKQGQVSSKQGRVCKGKITKFEEKVAPESKGMIKYQVSKDGEVWYYRNEHLARWEEVKEEDLNNPEKANDAERVNAQIQSFFSHREKKMYIKAFFGKDYKKVVLDEVKFYCPVETSTVDTLRQYQQIKTEGIPQPPNDFEWHREPLYAENPDLPVEEEETEEQSPLDDENISEQEKEKIEKEIQQEKEDFEQEEWIDADKKIIDQDMEGKDNAIKMKFLKTPKKKYKLQVKIINKYPPETDEKKSLGYYYQFKTTLNRLKSKKAFKLKTKFYYDSNDVQKLNVRKKDLRLNYYDPSSKKWIKIKAKNYKKKNFFKKIITYFNHRTNLFSITAR